MQKLIEWLKQLIAKYSVISTIPIPQPTPSIGCGCDLSLPLCDPNPSKYTQAYMDKNGRSEECGIEAELKLICRFCVITLRGFWMLSSLGRNHVYRDASNHAGCKCFTEDGYRYHIKGFMDVEPKQNEIRNVVSLKPNGKYIIVECRKA